MKKKVLVVDDDPIVRTLLVKMLRVRDIEVIEANQGFLAAKIFEKQKKEISLIVSDVQMPVMDGLELLQRVRATSPCPFVLFTGLGAVIEAKKAFEMGATDFLTKPVDKDVVRKIVDIFAAAESGAACELENRIPSPDEYLKIQLDDLITTTTINNDIYIRLSETKFVKVGRAGEKTPHERLKFYRDKKIDFLYVLTTEFGKYVESQVDLSRKALASPQVSMTTKMALLETSTRLIAENAFLVDSLDRESLEWTQGILNETVDFAADDPAIFEQLIELSKHSNHLYAHSLAVSLYACLVAKEHGWTAPQSIQKVSLGGLFHDIGKKELPLELLQKSRKNQSKDEIKMIESHCERGRDILLGIPGLPEEVVLIALHHHETKAGTGYPLRLKGEQINPLARLIAVVDKFVGFMLPIVPGEPALNAHDAMKKMQTFYLEELDPTFFKVLASVLKFPLEAKKKVS